MHTIWLFPLIGITFLFSLPAFINRSVLQGMLRFKHFVLSLLFENSTKLVAGILLVFIGYGVVGAVGSLILSVFVGWVSSQLFLGTKSQKITTYTPEVWPLIKYSLPVILFSIAATSLYSSDVLLTKHYLSPHDAGLYGAMTTLGRILLFGTSPIAGVMFPLIAQRKAQSKQYLNIFFLSLGFTFLLLVIAVVLFSLLPAIIVNLSFKAEFIEVAPYLVYYGIAVALFALASLVVNFYLALGETKVVILPIIAAIAQIVGITIFHQNLTEVIQVLIGVNTLLLVSCFVYFVYATKVSIRHRTRL